MADSMTTTTTNDKPEDDVLVLDEETVQLLHIIMEQEPLNKVCSECPQRSPGFVAFLAPPAVLVSDLEALGWHQRLGMGVFCCAGCMGYHMQVGNPVRKLKEGEILTKTEFLALEQTGNRVVNEIWEATMDGYDKDIEEEHEEEERKAYVVMKYQQLKYFDENAYKQHMAGRKGGGGVPASEQAKPESHNQTQHTAQDSQSNVSLTDVSLADLGYGEEQECGNGMIAQNNTSASHLSVPGEERGREIEQYQTPLRRRRNLSVTGDKRGSLGNKRGSLGEKRTSMGSGRQTQTPASAGQDRRKRFNMAGRQLSMPSLNLVAAESQPTRVTPTRINSAGSRALKQARGNRRASVDHSPQPPSAEERTRRKERRSGSLGQQQDLLQQTPVHLLGDHSPQPARGEERTRRKERRSGSLGQQQDMLQQPQVHVIGDHSPQPTRGEERTRRKERRTGSLGVENNLQPEANAEPIRKPRKVRSIGQLNMLDQPEEPNERPKGRGLRKQRQSSCRNLKLAGLESSTEHSVRQGRRGLMGRQKSAHNLGQISRERSKSKPRPQVPRQSSDGSLGYEQAIEDLKRGLPLANNGDPNGVDLVGQSPKRQGRRGMSRQKSATGLGEGTKPKSRSPKRSSMARPVRQSSLRSLSLEQYDPAMAAPKRGVSRKQSRRDLSVDQIDTAMEDIVRHNRSASKSLSVADVDSSKAAPKRGVSRKQSRRSITLDDAECDDAEEARALAARSRPSSRDVRGKETSTRKESSRRSSKRTSLDELHNQHTSPSQPVEVQSLASKEFDEKRRRQAQSLRGGKRSSLAEQRSHSSRHLGRSSSSRDLGNEDRSKDKKEDERRSSSRRESDHGRSRSSKKDGGSASDDRKSSRKSRRECDERRSSDKKKSSSSKSPKPSSSSSSSSKKDDKDKDTRPSRKEMIKEAKRNSARRLDCQDEVDPLEARMAMLKDAQRRASIAAS